MATGVGDGLLALLGGALPGYVQGRQQKIQQQRVDDERRKQQEKERKELTKFELDTLSSLQKIAVNPEFTPETRQTAQSRIQQIYGARQQGNAPTGDMLALPTAQQRGVTVSPELAQSNSLIPNEMVGENLSFDQFQSLQQENSKIQQQQMIQLQKRQQEALKLKNEYDGVTDDDLNTFMETGFLPQDALQRFKPKEKPNSLANAFEGAFQRGLGAARAKAVTALSDVEAVATDVLNVFDTFGKIPDDYRGPVAGRTIGQLGKLAKSNPDLVAYEDTKELMLANIAKKLGGEVGVLTDRDIERIKNSLPNLSDTNESAQKKMRYVMNYIDRRVKGAQKKANVDETGIGLNPEMTDANFDPNAQLQGSQGLQTQPNPGGGSQQQQPKDELDNYLDNLGL